MMFIGTLVILDRLYPPDLRRYNDLSRTVVAADGTILRMFTSADEKWRLPTRTEEVDPRYIAFLLAYEDKRFWSHRGVDFQAIFRAIGQWMSSGRIVSGASTITMQVARLLERRPRTFLSKSIEMFRAVQLEMQFAKSDILSMYLTLAPFGGNLEGVKAASLAYFGKLPRRLTVAEAALLVALPQSPTANRPDRHGKMAAAARARVLKRLALVGVVSPEIATEASTVPVEGRRRAFPFRAPHLARRLLSSFPNEAVIRTHVVPEYQAAVAGIVSAAIRSANQGNNVAAIVVDNKTANVLVYVASSDFFNTSRAGQVDYVQAVRSPGSALKPFIYAMAFDEGIAHPETILSDRVRRFGGYRPANFDGLSHGLVSARHALQKSLNIPAVALLHEVGPRRFLSRLQGIGINPKLRIPEGSPGLALALGGIGVSLEQLVSMYGSVARDGSFKVLSYSGSQDPATSVPFFGQRASMAVAAILRETPRPRGRYIKEDRGQVAFKTGTSSGYRDALALGFNDTYTVGVWLGDPKAKPMPGKTGANSAAPILLRIFDALTPPNERRTVVDAPAFLRRAPENLKTLQPGGGSDEVINSTGFSIAFPVDGSRIPLRQKGRRSATVFPIKMIDGQRPFSVFVNGIPIKVGNLTRSVVWTPGSLGFYSIVAVDRMGNVAASNVELSVR
ncbi:MAG: penicillin-binding protein 1C [Candidatus Magasanikbacteria bacterium]|nr:penicillin-binding protein 1C [Candidatus Magasanikbacteria bacterium]